MPKKGSHRGGQVQKLLRVAEEQGRAALQVQLLLTGFANGLRPGEVLGMQWHHLDWDLFTENRRTFGAVKIEETLKVEGGYMRDDGRRSPSVARWGM